MSSANPFGLLDDPISNDAIDSSAISIVPTPSSVVGSKPAAEGGASRWKRPNNAENQKSTSTKAVAHSEHAPARLVYSREWLLSCHKNYSAPKGFDGASSAFHELSQLPVALLPVTHEADDQEERGYYKREQGGGRGNTRRGGASNVAGGAMDGTGAHGNHAGRANTRGGDRGERGGRHAAPGYQAKSGDRYGGNSNDHQHHERGGVDRQHHDRQRSSGRDGALSAAAAAKFETEKPGDQSWLFDGGDMTLEGSLDDVAGRFGITTDEEPSGIPGTTLEAYENAVRGLSIRQDKHDLGGRSLHGSGSDRNSRANASEDWRRGKDGQKSHSSAAPGGGSSHSAHSTLQSSTEMKPRAARHMVQAVSAAPATIPNPSTVGESSANQGLSGANATSAPVVSTAATLDALWWYRDSKNMVQGPFTGSKMNSWLNFFTPDLLVGNGPSGPWSRLADRIVGGLNPFDGLALATSPHREFKAALAEFRAQHPHTPASHPTPQTINNPQSHSSTQTPSHGGNPLANPDMTQNAFLQHHALISTGPAAVTTSPQVLTTQPPAQTPAQAPNTPNRGAVKLDDLFGSAQPARPAQPAMPQQQAPMMQSHQQPQGMAAHHIWTNNQQTAPASFRQIQEQEAARLAATYGSAGAHGHHLPHGREQHFGYMQPHQHMASGHHHPGAGVKLTDTQSLFAMHFGTGAAGSNVPTATSPQVTSVPEPATADLQRASNVVPQAATMAPSTVSSTGTTSTQATNPTTRATTSAATEQARAQGTSTSSAAPAPTVIAAPAQSGGNVQTSSAPAKTSVNDLFDSARVGSGRSVPPPVVLPKGPGMYEIQQEEMRRAAEEKVVEEKRKEEAKRAHEAQRGMWAEPAIAPVVVPAKATTAKNNAKSMREIQEEQERELASQRQRQAEQRAAQAAAQPTRVVAPTFNGAWGASSGSGSGSKSLKEIQEEESRQAAASAAAQAQQQGAAAAAVTPKKTSWATTVSPNAGSLRQISAEQAVQPSSPSAPTAANKAPAAAPESESIWDYAPPSDKAAPAAAPKTIVGGVPKAGNKKKGQKKQVLNI